MLRPLHVLVSLQDTTVSWQRNKNWQGHNVHSVPKKPQNLNKDINTTMALYPSHMDENIKKEEEVRQHVGCWTR